MSGLSAEILRFANAPLENDTAEVTTRFFTCRGRRPRRPEKEMNNENWVWQGLAPAVLFAFYV